MTPQEVADHIAITQVLHRYFLAMDSWDYDLLESVFAPGATMRYDALQGADSIYPDMVPTFRSFNSHFSFMQHMPGQLLIELNGDTARSTNNLRAIHVQTSTTGEENEWVIYGIYRDLHVRTDAGWRIQERVFRQTRTVGSLRPFDQVERYETPPWL